jgi:hypothetical protein
MTMAYAATLYPDNSDQGFRMETPDMPKGELLDVLATSTERLVSIASTAKAFGFTRLDLLLDAHSACPIQWVQGHTD